MIDYGRPAKRGRVVFGGVVPYGKVWRTGANAATQFKTDKALDFGGTIVPAGFYTLWTLPTAKGWKLIVNGETGQWGTEHKPDKDLYTIDMQVTTLPQAVERFTIHVEDAPPAAEPEPPGLGGHFLQKGPLLGRRQARSAHICAVGRVEHGCAIANGEREHMIHVEAPPVFTHIGATGRGSPSGLESKHAASGCRTADGAASIAFRYN